jgi:hypothetical protein
MYYIKKIIQSMGGRKPPSSTHPLNTLLLCTNITEFRVQQIFENLYIQPKKLKCFQKKTNILLNYKK